jgi:hypothetical protein
MKDEILGSSATLIGGGTVYGDLDVTGDLTVEGDFDFGDAGTDVLTVAGYIQGSATGNTSVNIGGGTPTRITATTDDLFVTGEMEVDGTAWFDGLTSFYGTMTFSGGGYGSIRQGVDDGLKFCLTATDGLANHHMIVTSEANAAKDHDHETPSTDPTLFIHSATDPDTANDQWVSLSHDQTNGVISTGIGGVQVRGMILGTQGSDIASANDATLTVTGNYFDVTGAVQTNTLSVPAGLTNGTMITLQFDGAPTVKHATAGAGAQFQLASGADFVASAGDTLTLVYDGTYWREITNAVI